MDGVFATKDQIDEKEFITREGFHYAVQTNWHAPDGSSADIYLIQFASATGAQSFTLGYQSGSRNAVGTEGTCPIPGSGEADS